MKTVGQEVESGDGAGTPIRRAQLAATVVPHHALPAMLAALVALILAGCANTQTAATSSTTQAPAESQAEGSGEGEESAEEREELKNKQEEH